MENGMKTLLVLSGSLSALVAALALATGAAALDQSFVPFQPGNPMLNGCPAGLEALQVSDLAPLGYRVPSRVDSPANGGNADGVVCGRPWTPQEQAARLPGDTLVIFDFTDNTRTPSH
jgi:hypothetical protein